MLISGLPDMLCKGEWNKSQPGAAQFVIIKASTIALSAPLIRACGAGIRLYVTLYDINFEIGRK